MNKKNHFYQTLHHLYISPLEKCNLRCQICYTKKTSSILTKEQILNFIHRYQKKYNLQTVTLCGGEVFTLSYIPELINKLNQKGIFVQVITNGTVDRLDQIKNPNFVNLIISIDGLESYHDKNRGKGNFQKTISFLKKAKKKGFHTEIFSIVTKQNLDQIPEFENFLKKNFGEISVTYHPRKPKEYLNHHPFSNITGKITGFDFLSKEEIISLMKRKKTFPPKNLGCYQISLMSDGKIYGCCESYQSLGKINTSITKLSEKLKNNIKGPFLGCCQTEFMCGLKEIISNLKDQNANLS